MRTGLPQDFQTDCTVLSFDGESGLRDCVGSGSYKQTMSVIEHEALMDKYDILKPKKTGATVSVKMEPMRSGGNSWHTVCETGIAKTLVFTKANGETMTGSFILTEVGDEFSDKMDKDMTGRSTGPVTYGGAA